MQAVEIIIVGNYLKKGGGNAQYRQASWHKYGGWKQ